MQLRFNLFIFLALINLFGFSQNPIKAFLKHDKLTREYIYYTPKNLQPEAPLVVVLHGFTSSAERIMDYSKFNTIADENHFSVVYPQGTMDSDGNTFWNVGYTFHKDSYVDDVDYIKTLVRFLQEKHELSTTNTFLTGMSNGGEMCYLILCEKPELFKAVAPVAGMMLQSFFENCSSEITNPIFAVFGTKDNVTNFNGDTENKDGWGAYISIPNTIDYWAQKNGVKLVKMDTLPDYNKTDKSYIVRQFYQNTSTKKDILFYKVINGGHDWPGAWGNKDLFISQEIWTFFNRQMTP